MQEVSPAALDPDDVRTFVDAVLRTGLMLGQLIGDLLEDLSEDAFAGEEACEVLLQMLAGTITPVAQAAGRGPIMQAVALLDAVADRTLSDLRAAAELAASEER